MDATEDAAMRRVCSRPSGGAFLGAATRMTDRELARKNMVWGWALFAVFCALFGGTVLVAAAYLWLD